MGKYIDPTYDAGFKLTFGRENVSEDLLIGILNALLCNNNDFEEITSVEYLNNERTADWMDGKGIRYDILCETSSKHRFIVEMQKAHQPHFIDRASFYVARGVAEQGYKGKNEEDVEWDYSLKPVIGVFICNFNIPTLDTKVVVRARVLDEESFKPTGDKTRYYFIQLPQFDKKEEECEDLIDMWIYNLKNMGIRQEVAFMRNNEIFKRLAQVTSVATLTPEERRSYEADVKNARDTLNQIRGARMEGRAEGIAEGRAEGIAEGRAEGLAEGRAEGLAEGRAEGLAEGRAEGIAEGLSEGQYRIARVMLAKGWKLESISEITGLSIDVIENI